MINFSSSLFSYQHTPYQNSSPQKNALRLKELLSEIHTLDQEIEKIQNTLRISSTVPLEVTEAPNLTLCPKIIQTVDTFLEQAENETSQVIELEKKFLSLEKKFKLEKEKTHVEALKILKSFDEKFQNEEKLIKAKISDLHSSIANFSSQLEQKKFVSKITNLEKATPLILIKIQLLEERKKKNNRLFEEEINTIKHSLELLTSSCEQLCQTQQAITVPNTHSDEPQTPETFIPPPQSHEKPEKKKNPANKQL